jgi:hemoglobin-like flavoprotein
MAIDVKAIRNSFELAKPVATQVVDRFYENLFADFPESKPLFADVNMAKQKAALLNALVTSVDNLENSAVLSKFLTGLGERHLKYGVQEIHYDLVGKTLLKTFGQFLGSAWTSDLQGQWAEVYGVIAETMKAAARAFQHGNLRPISREKAGHANTTAVHASEIVVPDLSPETKAAIREAVRNAVKKLVSAEVKSCFDDEMRLLANLSADELLKKAG